MQANLLGSLIAAAGGGQRATQAQTPNPFATNVFSAAELLDKQGQLEAELANVKAALTQVGVAAGDKVASDINTAAITLATVNGTAPNQEAALLTQRIKDNADVNKKAIVKQVAASAKQHLDANSVAIDPNQADRASVTALVALFVSDDVLSDPAITVGYGSDVGDPASQARNTLLQEITDAVYASLNPQAEAQQVEDQLAETVFNALQTGGVTNRSVTDAVRLITELSIEKAGGFNNAEIVSAYGANVQQNGTTERQTLVGKVAAAAIDKVKAQTTS